MDVFFYSLGVFALGALIVYFIQSFERSKPLRALEDNPRRYYNKLALILSEYKKDDKIKEFLITAAEDLKKNYDLYKRYQNDEHLSSIFADNSFDKNREEALALCYLLSYRACPIINNMRSKFEKRFLELKNDTAACPPELYEPFCDIQNLIRNEKFNKEEDALKSKITEQLSRADNFRTLFPNRTIEQMLALFSKYRYDVHIYTPDDVTPESVKSALEKIHRAESKLHDVTKD